MPFHRRSGATLRACAGSVAPLAPRGHELSNRCYLERSELLDYGQELPWLFRYTKGLRIESIVIDSLDTAELGITAHVLGNTFQLCINARVFGATVDANVKNLASELDAWAKREKTPNRFTGMLTKDRICSSNSWPKLNTKGATARCLAPHALGLARKHLGPREQLVCQLLVRYYTLLASEGQSFSPAAKVEMPALGLRFCKEHSRLAERRRDRSWKVAPKLHLFFAPLRVAVRVTGQPKIFFGVTQTKTWSANSWRWQNRVTRARCQPRPLFKWLTFVPAEDHEDSCTDFLATKNIHIMMGGTETQNTHMMPRPQPTYNTHTTGLTNRQQKQTHTS